jgi:hypothetical protein
VSQGLQRTVSASRLKIVSPFSMLTCRHGDGKLYDVHTKKLLHIKVGEGKYDACIRPLTSKKRILFPMIRQ